MRSHDMWLVRFLSSKEKQAPSSKNMEPGEGEPLAEDPGGGIPDSKGGSMLGGDDSTPLGSEAATAAALLPEPSVKLQDGEGKDGGEVKQSKKRVTDIASDVTIAANGKMPTQNGGDGAPAAKEASAVAGVTESPSSSELKESTEGTSTAPGARISSGDSGVYGVRENAAPGTDGPGTAPSIDYVTRPGGTPREDNGTAANKASPTTASPEKVMTSGSGETLLAQETPPDGRLDSTAVAAAAAKTEEPTGGILTERIGADNGTAERVGGTAAGAGSMSPTPPKTRNSRGVPPQRGSRGGHLAICTHQPYSPGGEDGRDWAIPTSPRSRPRDQPLVRAKTDVRGEGAGASADGSGDDGEVVKEKVASFSSRRWKASDEYVLDEDR